MVSAHTEISAIERARDVGITEFVRKPIVPRALYERLIAVVNRKQEIIPAALTIPADDQSPVAFL